MTHLDCPGDIVPVGVGAGNIGSGDRDTIGPHVGVVEIAGGAVADFHDIDDTTQVTVAKLAPFGVITADIEFFVG